MPLPWRTVNGFKSEGNCAEVSSPTTSNAALRQAGSYPERITVLFRQAFFHGPAAIAIGNKSDVPK